MKINCSYCGKENDFEVGKINAAKKRGGDLYCNRKCSGLGRRTTKEDKLEKKRLYDIEYRRSNQEKIRINQTAYNESLEGRAMQKRARDKQKDYHLEYIKSPEYRKWKKNYDQTFRAKKNYGEFWESHILLSEITNIVDNKQAKLDKGTISKAQKRKRGHTY